MEPSQLTPVAPVVALLLRCVPLRAHSLSAEALVTLQASILNRILDSSADVPASNDILAILDGLIPAEDVPDCQSMVQWVDPRTGSVRSFRLQHAFDYAYTVDGDQPWPPSLRSSIGTSFCDDPLAAALGAPPPPMSQAPAEVQPIETTGGLLSLFAQEEYASSAHSTPRQSPRGNRRRRRSEDANGTVRPHPAARIPRTDNSEVARADPPRVAAALAQAPTAPLDTRVMEALLHQPDLLARYIQLVSSSQSAPAPFPTTDPEPTRRQSKYSFAPTLVQAAIHESITAPHHRGKHPALFVETVIHSAAVRFQPHPGVITRLFDFQFGMLGLSLLHFVPFGVHQRMEWLNTGGVNMQNFPAGVSVPRPQPAATMRTLVDAARVLCHYGQMYFAPAARDVLEALLDFLQQLDGWHTWIASDLPHLVFWVKSVLEQFRSRVQSSNGDAQGANELVRTHLSLNDGELQNVMHALARRPSVSTLLHQRTPGQSQAQARWAPQQQQPRIPRQIFDLIPKHNGRQICLRFLPVIGCSSCSSDRCNYGSRARVVPDALDARVKGHIIQRMGGLGEQFAHL